MFYNCLTSFTIVLQSFYKFYNCFTTVLQVLQLLHTCFATLGNTVAGLGHQQSEVAADPKQRKKTAIVNKVAKVLAHIRPTVLSHCFLLLLTVENRLGNLHTLGQLTKLKALKTATKWRCAKSALRSERHARPCAKRPQKNAPRKTRCKRKLLCSEEGRRHLWQPFGPSCGSARGSPSGRPVAALVAALRAGLWQRSWQPLFPKTQGKQQWRKAWAATRAVHARVQTARCTQSAS